MIGIIGAMDDEVNMIKKKITDPTVTKLAGCDFVCGHIEGVMVCVVQCSPGKVNAALCAQALADNFSPDCIINVGVGCSLSDDVVIKNIVVASDVCEYDIDITALGEPKGFINGINTVKIPTDFELSEALAQTAINCGERIHRGTVATGDTFIASGEMKQRLSRDFGAICGEMEGGAIGHVCAANNIPFAVLRSISDGGDENALMDYPTFKKIAAEMSTAIMVKFIKTRKTQLSLF
ncbi:MAG: 5'-methylthioadenosine/adenosylhomocysteine nucleosidase [Eubacterium sp.]